MPWTSTDAHRFSKHAVGRLAKAWARVANNVLRAGKSEEEAIKIANAYVRKRAQKGEKKES